MFTRITEIETVRLGGPPSVYNAIGDLFAKFCLALTCIGVLVAFTLQLIEPSKPAPFWTKDIGGKRGDE